MSSENRTFFDEDERLEKISKLGDNLEKLNRAVDWEMFRETIEKVFEKEKKGAGGRPAYDAVMMFKILVLQRIYNISDEQTEFQINDRMSFMRFLGLNLCDRVPDAKTIWHFRNEVSKAGTAKRLFKLFNKRLEQKGIIKNEGVIVDATFIDAPRQRNSRSENREIKEGKLPEEWKSEEKEMKNKVRQKDTDARWTKKRDERHYGYKNHIAADAGSKLILRYTSTSASVHDSREFKNLVRSGDKTAYADAGYAGKERELPEDVEAVVCEKGYRNRPLTDLQKLSNKIKSKIRSRVRNVSI